MNTIGVIKSVTPGIKKTAVDKYAAGVNRKVGVNMKRGEQGKVLNNLAAAVRHASGKDI